MPFTSPSITALALALAAATAHSGASAQEAQSMNRQAVDLDAVVVTGTPKGRSQKDAPFAISVISEETLQRRSATSSVDMLRAVPGISAEPSGGQGGGQNLYVRGLPAGGWFYMQYQEDGLTLFDEPQESFLNIDNLFSLDMMTERLEVVRGGTSPLFATNAPGGTVNAITRHGTATPEGAVRLTNGSNGQWRQDAYSAGPLSENVLYSIGGFHRTDDGLRRTGYTADKGGQLRGTLTFLLGDAVLDVDAKLLNDRTAFYNPIPLRDPRVPDRSLSALIDPLDGTLLSSDLRHTTVPTFFGNQLQQRSLDLADGIHTNVKQFGTHLEWGLGHGVTLDNRMRYVSAQVDYTSLFSGAAPSDAAGYLGTQLGRARTGFGANVARTGYVIAADGSPYDPSGSNGLVLESGLWNSRTRLRTLSDDLRLSKAFDASEAGQHTVTAGINVQHFEYAQDRLQNTVLTTLRNNPQRLDVLAYDAAGNMVGAVTQNGFVRYGNGVTRGFASGTYLSPHLWDSVKFGRFSLDAGMRYTRYTADGGVYANTNRNLGDPTTLADDNVGGLSGTFNARDDRQHALQWTVGGEYAVNPALQAFARYTASQRLPRLQNVYQTQNAAVTDIDQGEVGLRGTVGDALSLSSVAFWSRFNDLSISAIVLDATGAVQNLNLVGSTQTLGLESEFTWRPVDLFGMTGSVTLQDPQTKSLSNATTNSAVPGLNGNQISRIPKYIVSLSPTLYFDIAGKPTELTATAYRIGQRYVDYTNATALPAYTSYDLGLSTYLSKHLELQLHAANISNVVGLTEGNARVDTLSGQGTAEAIYARPIFGRNYTASLTWRW
ncbi:TonB-dependent receptor domain-containing protein [Xanthomonas phaseoli]|uniref:TonB-dependent receptor n=1 Tax=Xanthomonas phaseoli pv. dieffenbachiae TaxID=92828 RepID=A0A1V9HB81_9XANT|nr:TonB-dependent receptor [Xanthomonas phaseoli]MBO9790169.1 TonB-dependent receptor plug domain-containing protein [Xanthomonas phaseoli pv. dieffenbachiae]MBO9833032.1 TonB-dependent receptor plug domain-containing protein [Xanthomonas phaseoli pv. dieffenbachiae]MBO9838463.1 TonB-dependent receptor plug domain-containing protein [Xanthomonas phaseoli pv. dieffenbachiae]MBO9842943.1 TonB-dependent receptor plug domain-containing protein [Xanthomonas phaseoli pv. dieffenbachiae]MBO9863319.1 